MGMIEKIEMIWNNPFHILSVSADIDKESVDDAVERIERFLTFGNRAFDYDLANLSLPERNTEDISLAVQKVQQDIDIYRMFWFVNSDCAKNWEQQGMSLTIEAIPTPDNYDYFLSDWIRVIEAKEDAQILAEQWRCILNYLFQLRKPEVLGLILKSRGVNLPDDQIEDFSFEIQNKYAEIYTMILRGKDNRQLALLISDKNFLGREEYEEKLWLIWKQHYMEIINQFAQSEINNQDTYLKMVEVFKQHYPEFIQELMQIKEAFSNDDIVNVYQYASNVIGYIGLPGFALQFQDKDFCRQICSELYCIIEPLEIGVKYFLLYQYCKWNECEAEEYLSILKKASQFGYIACKDELIEILKKEKKYDELIEIAQTMLGNDAIRAHMLMGQAYEAMGNLETAIEHYKMCTSKYEIEQHIGALYQQLMEDKLAFQYMLKGILKQPDYLKRSLALWHLYKKFNNLKNMYYTAMQSVMYAENMDDSELVGDVADDIQEICIFLSHLEEDIKKGFSSEYEAEKNLVRSFLFCPSDDMQSEDEILKQVLSEAQKDTGWKQWDNADIRAYYFLMRRVILQDNDVISDYEDMKKAYYYLGHAFERGQAIFCKIPQWEKVYLQMQDLLLEVEDAVWEAQQGNEKAYALLAKLYENQVKELYIEDYSIFKKKEIACYERAAKAGHIPSFRKLAALYKEMNRRQEQINMLEFLARIGDKKAKYNLCDLYLEDKQTEKALKMLEDMPNSREIDIKKADCYRLMGEYDSAIFLYQSAMLQEETEYILYRHIGDCYIQKEQYRTAYEYYQRIMEAWGQDMKISDLLGHSCAIRIAWISAKNGNVISAVTILRRVLHFNAHIQQQTSEQRELTVDVLRMMAEIMHQYEFEDTREKILNYIKLFEKAVVI